MGKSAGPGAAGLPLEAGGRRVGGWQIVRMTCGTCKWIVGALGKEAVGGGAWAPQRNRRIEEGQQAITRATSRRQSPGTLPLYCVVDSWVGRRAQGRPHVAPAQPPPQAKTAWLTLLPYCSVCCSSRSASENCTGARAERAVSGGQPPRQRQRRRPHPLQAACWNRGPVCAQRKMQSHLRVRLLVIPSQELHHRRPEGHHALALAPAVQRRSSLQAGVAAGGE